MKKSRRTSIKNCSSTATWLPEKHDGLLIAVEIELDNDVWVKPCPLMKLPCGATNYSAIRGYFERQNFTVGQILSIKHGMHTFL
jgi:hypothetical protein